MSLKHLTTQTMIALSKAWLDPEGEMPLLEGQPMTAALLPTLQEAHDGLIKTQPAASRTVSKEEALKEEQVEKDGLHDRKARGLYLVLEGFGALVDAPELRDKLLGLQGKLFKTGLKVVNFSYLDEAGEVELVEERLNDDDRDLLASLPYPEGTLQQAHDARITAARDLGKLEHKIADLSANMRRSSAITGADVIRARNVWIRAVRAFLAIIDLVALEEQDRNRLLTPLNESMENASRRQKARRQTRRADGQADGQFD